MSTNESSDASGGVSGSLNVDRIANNLLIMNRSGI